jgi:hypothetical protein
MIDFLSIILSTIGFGAMLYGFSIAGKKGWSDISVVATIIAGTVISALFIWRQLAMEHPMLEMRVFKSSIFTLTTVMSNVAASNAPDKALAKTNVELYKSGMLDATLKGVNTTFMFVIALTMISLVISFFLKGEKEKQQAY